MEQELPSPDETITKKYIQEIILRKEEKNKKHI